MTGIGLVVRVVEGAWYAGQEGTDKSRGLLIRSSIFARRKPKDHGVPRRCAVATPSGTVKGCSASMRDIDAFLRGARGPRASSVLKIPGLTCARQANGETRAAMQRPRRTSRVLPTDAESRNRLAGEMASIEAVQPLAMSDLVTPRPCLFGPARHRWPGHASRTMTGGVRCWPSPRPRPNSERSSPGSSHRAGRAPASPRASR
jgi:hypothetical protein